MYAAAGPAGWGFGLSKEIRTIIKIYWLMSKK